MFACRNGGCSYERSLKTDKSSKTESEAVNLGSQYGIVFVRSVPAKPVHAIINRPLGLTRRPPFDHKTGRASFRNPVNPSVATTASDGLRLHRIVLTLFYMRSCVAEDVRPASATTRDTIFKTDVTIIYLFMDTVTTRQADDARAARCRKR
jgi:hypothetical protein